MSKTLLLADDSVTIQKVVGISFANEDVELVTVDNGDDAIARVRETRPDAVLADVVMPGKSGYEVCEAIKSEPELRHIPVLLLTGTFEAFDAERAQRAGADGHITKPFEAQTLVDRVNELLGQAEAPAADLVQDGPAVAQAAEIVHEVDPLEIDAEEEAFVFEAEETTIAELAETEAPVSDEERLADPFAETAAQATLVTEAPEIDEDWDDADPVLEVRPGAGPADDVTQWTSGPDDLLEASEEPIVSQATPADPDEARADLLGVDDLTQPEAPLTEPGELDLDPAPQEAAAQEAAAQAASEPDPLGDGPLDTIAPLEPTSPSDLDLGLDEVPDLSGPTPDDLSHATVLDPVGSDAFDVSSSDLGTPLEQEVAPDLDAPQADATAFDEVEPEAFSAEAEAEVVSAEAEPEAFSAANDLPEIEPPVEPASLLAAALDPEPTPAPPAPPAHEPAAPDVSQEPPAETVAGLQREEVLEQLEKVAWEAFGDLTESLVRQTVEKVEAIAWEVIPQMAETLIRDEIRRLKDED